MHNLRFSDQKILEQKTWSRLQITKAIIIAAGLGSRLGELTRETPKCMLKINDKSILERQLDAYRANGITEFSVIRDLSRRKN